MHIIVSRICNCVVQLCHYLFGKWHEDWDTFQQMIWLYDHILLTVKARSRVYTADLFLKNLFKCAADEKLLQTSVQRFTVSCAHEQSCRAFVLDSWSLNKISLFSFASSVSFQRICSLSCWLFIKGSFGHRTATLPLAHSFLSLPCDDVWCLDTRVNRKQQPFNAMSGQKFQRQ